MPKDNTNYFIVAVVAIVAIVGLVVLYMYVSSPQAGVAEQAIAGKAGEQYIVMDKMIGNYEKPEDYRGKDTVYRATYQTDISEAALITDLEQHDDLKLN